MITMIDTYILSHLQYMLIVLSPFLHYPRVGSNGLPYITFSWIFSLSLVHLLPIYKQSPPYFMNTFLLNDIQKKSEIYQAITIHGYRKEGFRDDCRVMD